MWVCGGRVGVPLLGCPAPAAQPPENQSRPDARPERKAHQDMPIFDLFRTQGDTVEMTDADPPRDSHAENAVCQNGHREREGQAEKPRPALRRRDRPNQEEGG
jgi:hypothetical protein